MRFAPKMSAKDRSRVEDALPAVLNVAEVPTFAVTATKPGGQQMFMVLTRDRVLGLDALGKTTLELGTRDVFGVDAEHSQWSAKVTLKTRAGSVGGGMVHSGDWSVLCDELAVVCPRVTTATRRPPVPSASVPVRQPVPPLRLTSEAESPRPEPPTPDLPTSAHPPSIVDQLTQLAALTAQGLLSDAEYAAAKSKLLGTPSEAAVQPPMQRPSPPTAPTRRRGKKVTEMERTCTQDGTKWFVPLDVATMVKPSRLTIGGLKMQEFGTTALLMPGGMTASTQLNRLESAWARAQMARQCPTCGSQAFTERRIKH